MNTTVSAPGKVLVTGGYLVLDRAFAGSVLGVSARFHSSIQSEGPAHAAATGLRPVQVAVHSPQVSQHVGQYTLQLEDLALTNIAGDKNKFVVLSLRVALAVLSSLAGASFASHFVHNWAIHLRADPEFYTPPAPNTPPGTSLGKTGLGSSAGLVASLVSAVFVHCLPADVALLVAADWNAATEASAAPTSASSANSAQLPVAPASPISAPLRDLCHMLAQIVHCAAQGKVGSGFDISTATYGTQFYRRFSADSIEAVITVRMSPILFASVFLIMDMLY